MLQALRKCFNQLSERAVQYIMGGITGLTTALASIQNTGCNGMCKTCQNCSVAGFMLIAVPLFLKFQWRIPKVILRLSLVALPGAGLVVWNLISLK